MDFENVIKLNAEFVHYNTVKTYCSFNFSLILTLNLKLNTHILNISVALYYSFLLLYIL